MKEKHFAYKIFRDAGGLVTSQFEFEEENMLDLLTEIVQVHSTGIYWIFKQFKGKPQQALCIIDCEHNRIYYHYSGEVEDIVHTIQKLSHQK